MNKQIYTLGLIAVLIVGVVLVSGCVESETSTPTAKVTTEQTTTQTTLDEVEPTPTCPDSCNDGNACTKDYCSSETNYQCKHDAITPCCGNKVCEETESYDSCPSDCEKPKSWHDITTVSGVSNMVTDSFHIPGEKWRFAWECIEQTSIGGFEIGSGMGGVNIFVYPEGETVMYLESIFMGKCKGPQTTYIHQGPGDYYFNVQSANVESWYIKVDSYH